MRQWQIVRTIYAAPYLNVRSCLITDRAAQMSPRCLTLGTSVGKWGPAGDVARWCTIADDRCDRTTIVVRSRIGREASFTLSNTISILEALRSRLVAVWLSDLPTRQAMVTHRARLTDSCESLCAGKRTRRRISADSMAVARPVARQPGTDVKHSRQTLSQSMRQRSSVL